MRCRIQRKDAENAKRNSIKLRVATTARSATLRRRLYAKGRHSEGSDGRRRHLVAVRQIFGQESNPTKWRLAKMNPRVSNPKSEIEWLGWRSPAPRRPLETRPATFGTYVTLKRCPQ